MSRQQRPAQKGERKHVALEDDILATGPLKQKAPKRKQRHENEFGDEKYVDAKASRKILKIGQELADEDEAENASKNVKPTAFDFQMRDEEGDAGPDSDDEAGAKERFGEEVWGDEEEEVEEIEMDPNDLETYKKFFPSQEDDLLRTGGQWGAGEEGGDAGMGGETNLADLILEKIAEAEARKEGQFLTGAIEEEEFELPEKVKEVYTKYVPCSPLPLTVHN